MSLELDKAVAQSGTRFRIFPQPRFLPSFQTPEVVTVSVPPSAIRPGPADGRMFVVDAVNKLPYEGFDGPPYLDAANPPVQPGPQGHFDHLDPDSREFSCATMYATVRRALDIWEDYFGREIPWFFEADFERLELIPLIEWDNAQSGYGFLEFGFGRTVFGTIDHSRPYCENFDVLTHELGHNILFAVTGLPATTQAETADFGGYHESGGDLTAIVAALHFQSVVRHLLAQTRGNLFTVNELDRVGELSDSREIRVAFNSKRLGDVGTQPHERSLPLTGGIFDVMVEVFQKKLVERGLISADLARRSTQGPGGSSNTVKIQQEFDAAFQGQETIFTQLLLEARDYLGRLLARTWSTVDPNFLTYLKVVRKMLQADREITGGQHQQTIRECFAWRGIASAFLVSEFRPRTLDSCSFAIRNAVSARVPVRPPVNVYDDRAPRISLRGETSTPTPAPDPPQPRAPRARPAK